MTSGYLTEGLEFDEIFVRKGTLISSILPPISGSLWGWGDDYYAQLGGNHVNYQTDSPVQTIAGGTNWTKVSNGGTFVSAIKKDGTLWGWGLNDFGQLGDNTRISRSSPVQIGVDTSWVEISCGANSSAAIKKDGSLWTWGNDNSLQLGSNNSFTINRSSPIQIAGGGNTWSKISCGYQHMAAIKTDGTLWAWGNNGWNLLGIDNNNGYDISSPVQIAGGGNNWFQVSCGNYNTAAIKTNGTLWTWGDSEGGALANNLTYDNISSPVQVGTSGDWAFVCSSVFNSVMSAIKTDGTLWSWGFNNGGILGIGETTHRSSPVQTIAGGTNWATVSLGQYNATAIKQDGTLWTWGGNWNAQLGLAVESHESKSSPVQIGIGYYWKLVDCGDQTVFAIR